jgi:three-Cys-motif partner protein
LILSGYLRQYTTAPKDKPTPQRPFIKGYIDAFAGTGYRNIDTPGGRSDTQDSLLPDMDVPEQALLDGSAKLALQIEPAFDRYVFIERSAAKRDALEQLKASFPAKAITIKPGDANANIQDMCAKNWRNHRAVLFLDPYGMQVEWTTIQGVADTRGIDMWLLFPLGIGVNRLVTKDGNIPASWRARLDALLGTTDWYEEFYRVERTTDLFGNDVEFVVKASVETIGAYFVRRLKSVFVDVAEPRVLRNSRGNPLYLLCFAAGNKNGAPIAMRIARHLLKRA